MTYEVRDRSNQSMIHNPDNDVVISRHRSRNAAQRVVDAGTRRARRMLGLGAYTTLYVHEEAEEKGTR